MMTLGLLILLASSGNAGTAPASLQSIRYVPGGIRLQIPASWTHASTEDNLIIHSAGGRLSVELWLHPEWKGVEDAAGDLVAALGSRITEIELDSEDPEVLELDGMQALRTTGTGRHDGSALAWDLVVLFAKKPVVILTEAKPGGEHPTAPIEPLIQSIRKAE